jgi:hypothetical protein
LTVHGKCYFMLKHDNVRLASAAAGSTVDLVVRASRRPAASSRRGADAWLTSRLSNSLKLIRYLRHRGSDAALTRS